MREERKTILAVVAHPDDEVLGCGGTLAAAVGQGHEVHVVYLADGESSRMGIDGDNTQIEKRYEEALNACKILGTQKPIFLGFPDNCLDSKPLLEIVQSIEPIFDNIKPEIVFTHHCGDLNVDHRITHQTVLTACRPQPNYYVKRIYAFEVLSSTEWAYGAFGENFQAQRFIDISATLNVKLLAADAYSHELRAFPHARSKEAIKALAQLRGVHVGVPAAEAFSVIRELTDQVV